MPKILLIRPPSTISDEPSHTSDIAWPPLGLASLAAYIRQLGDAYNVEIRDLVIEPSKPIAEVIESLQPDYIGIGCMSSDYLQAVDVANEIKRVAQIPIVFGGVHPTVDPVRVLSNASVDYIVVGDGEYTFAELVQSLFSGSEISQVKGIGYKKHDRLIINPMRRPIGAISSLPFPAYDLLPVGLYAQHAERDIGFRPLDMVVSRGCPFRCSFCAATITQGRYVRFVKASSLLGAIQKLLHTHALEGVWFKDSNFTINKNWTTEFSNEVQAAGLDFPWACNTRVDLVDEKLLQAMKCVGLKKIWFGVESGSRKSLRTLSKDISLKRTKATFQICKQLGIQTGAFFMIGIPGEKIEDIRATLSLAYELNADQYRWHVFTPLPGSRLYDLHKERLTGFSPRFDRAAMGTGYLSAEEINEIYQEICSHFYRGRPPPSFY